MLRKAEIGKRSAAAGDPGGGGRLLDEIEALSRALSLTKKPAGGAQKPLPPDARFRSISAGKSHFSDQRAKPRVQPKREPQQPPPPAHPQKEKRMSSESVSSFSSSTSSSIWNWKPLRALSHIRHRRFDCRFTLQVHSVEGLPPGFNNAGLVVHWKRNLAEIGLRTRPATVIGGAAEIEETLEHRCAVYGSRGGGPHHTAKYEARQFVLYPSVVGAPELDLGKHRVDLTRLLPLTLEELEEDSSGKWSTSFKLSGKARGATLNVSFGFSLLARGDVAESGGHRKVSELLLAEAQAEEAEDRVSNQNSLKRLGSVPVASHASKARPRFSSQSLDNVKVFHEILPASKSETVALIDAEPVPADAKCDDGEFDTPADVSNSEVSPGLEAAKLPELMEGDTDKEFDCPDFTVIEHGIEIATKGRVTDGADEHDELREVDERCRPNSEDDVVEKGVPQGVEKGRDGSEESSPKLVAVGGELLPFDDNHRNDVEAASEPLIESTRSEFSSCAPCGHSHGDDIILASEPAMEDLASALRGFSISGSVELEPHKGGNDATDQLGYIEVKSNYKTGKMSKSLSLDDVTESVASEFLSMLGIEHSPFGLSSDSDPESPRERLWRQFKKETLTTKESIFDLDMENRTELDWGEYPDDFDLSTIVNAAEAEHKKATQALKSKTRAKLLEDAETEALMREWGLNENAFHHSPPGSRSGFGSPIDLPPEDPPALPPLGEGLGPFIQTKDGGFLRSMNPSLFNNSKHHGSLIMQVSSPVVMPAEMGSNVMEILQHLASAGIEKLSMQASKIMPLEDITGRTMQQVAWESLPAINGCERHDPFQHVNPEAELGPSHRAAGKRKKGKHSSSNMNSSAAEMSSDYVSLGDLAPLAMDKIEALSIEGLRIQSGMSDEDAPSNISPQSIGEISALEGREAKNKRSLGLEGAAGLQLLDVKDNSDNVDGLMGLSISLDEWMRLDSGVIDEDEISDRTSKVLAAHHAASAELVTGGWKGERRRGRNSGRRWGLLGNNFTVALMVQLRDPLRNYEPVGTPMLGLVQVERVFIPPKPKIYSTVSDKGNSEQDDEEPETKVQPARKEEKQEQEEVVPQFKITEVHVAGLKTDPGKRKLWGNATQQQSGSRWLLANGMGKSNKHPFMKSKTITKPSQVAVTSQVTTPSQVVAPSLVANPQLATTVKPGDSLWSISSRVHGTGAKWKELAKLNPHIRNPNIILPNETIRLR